MALRSKSNFQDRVTDRATPLPHYIVPRPSGFGRTPSQTAVSNRTSVHPAIALRIYETNADQCDAGKSCGRDRRRPEALRPRHRDTVERTEQSQHLQRPHHPRRALPRSLLRRLRRRAPRLPAAQGNLPRLLLKQPESGDRVQHPRAPARRPGNHRPGREGRARQQGRGADDVHLPGRPLPGADAEQPARAAASRAASRATTATQLREAMDSCRSPTAWAASSAPPASAARRRAAVGPQLPARSLERDQAGVVRPPGAVPDLPGINAIMRALRDYFSPTSARSWSTPAIYEEAQRVHAARDAAQPRASSSSTTTTVPLFTRFQIENQIETAYRRKVHLPSGGAS